MWLSVLTKYKHGCGVCICTCVFWIIVKQMLRVVSCSGHIFKSSVLFGFSTVHPWSQCCFTPSPHCTTFCYIRKVPRWQCVSLGVCKKWWHCCSETTMSSFWPSQLTVCRFLLTGIKKARYVLCHSLYHAGL